MNDTKLIGRISVVTDSEVSYSNIGDVEAGLNERELRQHIEKHGPAGLYEAISYLSFQVFEAVRELNAKKEKDVDAKVKFLTEPILPIKVQHDKPIKTDGRLSPISLLEDPFDRSEYLAKRDAGIGEAKELLFPKKDNQQEAKRPTWEEAVATNNAEQIIGLLRKGDKFKVVKEFVANGNQQVHRLTEIVINTIDEDFIHTWRNYYVGTPFFRETFSKAEFVQLIAFGNIKQILPPPPVNVTK